ncbi:hypothetical protein SeLEV6574_g01350 [Synchytrium endobioticum]|nr:hypothetical protein SeLEV6574_g01350 [Synchytrium endobioticum]
MAALLRFLFHPPQTSGHPPANSDLVDARDPFLLARQTYYGPFFILQGSPAEVSLPENGMPATASHHLLDALGHGHVLTEPELGSLRGVFTEQLAPPEIMPTTTLQALVSIHKTSVKLIPQPEDPTQTASQSTKYLLQFQFDAAAPCQLRIYQACREVAVIGPLESRATLYKTTQGLIDTIATPTRFGPFPVGLRQTFVTPPSFSLDSSNIIADTGEQQHNVCIPQVVISHRLSSTQLDSTSVNSKGKTFPLIIVIEALEGMKPNNVEAHILPCTSQSTFVTFSMDDHGLQSHVSKQKIMINGVSYLVQEIFGFTEPTTPTQLPESSENAPQDENSTRDCVVCLSELKDTVVLPCRHLCLCTTCASVLRLQGRSTSGPSSYASRVGVPKCPICRQPFHALLQITLPDENHDDTNNHNSNAAVSGRRPSVSGSNIYCRAAFTNDEAASERKAHAVYNKCPYCICEALETLMWSYQLTLLSCDIIYDVSGRIYGSS